MGSKFSCVAVAMKEFFLDLLQAAKSMVGCGSVCNL